jgi:molecular chaperone GrpE
MADRRNPRNVRIDESASARDSEATQPPAEADAAAIDDPVASPATAATEPLARLQAEKDDLLQTLVRRQADFENYRKRIERERAEDRDRVSAALIEALLPVLDGFERALAAHREGAYEEHRKGFELIYRQLLDALTRQGLTRIESVGQPFDPHYHHAVEKIETRDHADGTVLEELQPGYKLRDRLLRPAMVRVAVHAQREPRSSSGVH